MSLHCHDNVTSCDTNREWMSPTLPRPISGIHGPGPPWLALPLPHPSRVVRIASIPPPSQFLSPDRRLSSSRQVFASRRAAEAPGRSASQPTPNDSSPCARCSPSQAGSHRSQPLVGRARYGDLPPGYTVNRLPSYVLFISFRLGRSLSIPRSPFSL